jgi:hypothetical protein
MKKYLSVWAAVQSGSEIRDLRNMKYAAMFGSTLAEIKPENKQKQP